MASSKTLKSVGRDAKQLTRRDLISVACVTAALAATEAAAMELPQERAFDPTSRYSVRDLRGWKLLTNEALAGKRALFSDVMGLLDHQLYQITRVVPAQS